MSEQLVDYVVLYRDAAGEWRWSACAGNNEKVADSGEGYKNHADCEAAAKALFPSTPMHDVEQ